MPHPMLPPKLPPMPHPMLPPKLYGTLAALGLVLATAGCSGLTRSDEFKIRKEPLVQAEPPAPPELPNQAGAIAAPGFPQAPARAPGTG